ncbi:DNA polymerase beta palm domain-containing protein [Trichoderma breve]|uniref:DNA polymerase lambda n=1 Tax=Trichoderma breve TaxID=2034170 RepID=A0A9W9B3Z8_9HYPO|nr:DNA polymerase beta palm domain-containing protein [Trichoderma breve]KAJ4855152.1 DNA polymerase beta palm domain-containing protein [Trichoderma breve]
MDDMESKTAYFNQLSSFSFINDGMRDDDAFDAREERQRELHRGFFQPAPSLHAPDQEDQTQRHEQRTQQDQQARKQQDKSLPVKSRRLQHLTPRKVIAAPRPESGKVIKGTGPGKPRPKGRLGALLDGVTDVVQETPSVNLEKRGKEVIVIEDGPELPRTSASLKRSLESASEESSSPSVNVKAGMTTKAARGNKRGRISGPNARPEAEQIFKGLSFFYIPDNDIAPARRLRINRAKEFGATWTRDLMMATHVVVEKKLEYRDVEKLWPKDGFGDRAPPKVVTEDYPLDCIQFRAIVDASQRKYLVNGQPEVDERGKEPEIPVPTTNSGAQEKPKSKLTVSSLPLKPQHHNKAKWDYVPPKGTPSQSEESSLGSRVTRSRTGAVAVDSQPVVLDLEDAGEPKKDISNDELSEYILMLQEFKDLPLDIDEEEDVQSTSNEAEAPLDRDHRYESETESQRTRRSSRRTRPTSKAIAFEDRFACNRAGRKDANQNNPNARTIEILQKMNSYYERVNDHWRTIAYRKAISILKQQSVKITTEEEAYRLPTIGRRLAQKIEEIVTTDKLKRLECAEEDPTDHALQTFLKIYGVGNKIAEQWIAQGWRTLEDVKQNVKLTPSQLIGMEHYDDLNTRIPRKEVTALGEVVKKAAARIDSAAQLIIGGSYRRGAESSHDIDFIVTKPGTESVADLKSLLNSLLDQLERDKFLVARLASSRSGGDGSKWHGCCVLPKIKGLNDTDGEYRPIWRRIDFLLVPEVELGAALIYFTGNDIFNRSMRLLASKKGMRLNQRGLYRDVLRGPNRAKITAGELVESRDEKRIFEILGVKWREPWERWC